MGVAARSLRVTDDWWRVRALLVESGATSPPGWNWDIRRWDGWRFHRERPLDHAAMARIVGLWETAGGSLVGAVHPEESGTAFLQLDPRYRHLEPAMLDWAEEHLAAGSLSLYVADEDHPRRDLLAARGYAPAGDGGWLRRLRFDDADVPPVPAIAGPYRVRTTEQTDDDCARMADLLNAAFGRTTHTAREYRNFVDLSPSFDSDLNLVSVAPDGSFAAHVGLTFDAVNRHGIVEPVCTHPDHRRAGLARALVLEGVRRLEARGARTASLDTGEGEAANALYAACGFTEAHHGEVWRRSL